MTKLIHQIWIGPEIPQRFRERSKEIEQLNPEYELIRWSEELIKEFPEIKEYLILGCVPVYICDYARIRILHKYGGWYIDYDYKGFDSIESMNLPRIGTIGVEFYGNFRSNAGFIYSNKGLFDDLMRQPDKNLLQLWIEIQRRDNESYIYPNSRKFLYGTKGSYKLEFPPKEPSHTL